jgi:hypothetical protein
MYVARAEAGSRIPPARRPDIEASTRKSESSIRPCLSLALDASLVFMRSLHLFAVIPINWAVCWSDSEPLLLPVNFMSVPHARPSRTSSVLSWLVSSYNRICSSQKIQEVIDALSDG